MHVQTGSTFNFVRSHSEKTNSKLPALIFGRVNFLEKKKKKESKIKQVITSILLQKFTIPIHRYGGSYHDVTRSV